MRKVRAPLIGLIAVTIVGVLLAMGIVTVLRNPVEGKVLGYSATFTDASGLLVTNDVRISGVQVGKVQKIWLDGKYAKVKFTVVASQQLYQNTVVAIKFNSVIGQRYVELVQPKNPGERLRPGADVPLGRTIPSFDVAKLFNAFRPVFQVLTPEQFNQLGQNLLRVIQGEQDGIGPILRDIEAVMKVAVDRKDTLIAVIRNLSQVSKQLGGTSRQLMYLINSLDEVTQNFVERADYFNKAVADALPLLRNYVRILQYAEKTVEGSELPVYDLMSRMFPQTPTIMAGLSLLPDLVQGMRDSLIEDRPVHPAFECSNGVATLPGVGEVSFANQDLVICK